MNLSVVKKLKSKYTFFLFLILLLAFVLRFYKLGQIPLGLYTDETAIGYNAYSILESGKDEHGVKHPLYFKSYGDNKLPVYIYLTSGFIKLLGPTQLSVRVTSAIFGVLSVLVMYLLINLLSKNRNFALMAAFLLAINPWSIHFSRVAFEVNVALSLILAGTYFFFLATTYQKKKYLLIIPSIICFILSLYCYNVTRVLSPLLFFSLVVFSRFTVKKIENKFYIYSLFLFFLGTIPFIASFLDYSGLQDQATNMITGGQVSADRFELRSYFATAPFVISRLLFNNIFLTIWEFVRNVVKFFSFDFFFVNGANHPVNGVMNYGMFHLFEVITIPIGLFLGIKNRIKHLYPFYIWIVLVIVLGSITKEVPHPTRTFGILFPFTIFSAYGLLFIIEKVKTVKNPFRNLLYVGITGILIFGLTFFLTSYFYYAPYKFAEDWRAKDQELALFLKENAQKYDRIILDQEAGISYASLLYYGQYPPDKLQKDSTYGSDGLLTTLKKFGKYEFRKIDWGKDKNLSKSLFVTRYNKTEDLAPIKTINFPIKHTVFFYDNKLQKIEKTDPAYIIYEVK